MARSKKIMLKRSKPIRALISSVSGVLNNNNDIIGVLDGKIFMGFERSHYDGQGVSLLRAIGIHVAFIHVDPYNPDNPVSKIVERWDTLPSTLKPNGWPPIKLISGVIGSEQIAPVEDWLKEIKLTFEDCVIMGHDLVQVPIMRFAKEKGSYLVAPVQAEGIVKEMVDYVTARQGGNGALRDLANLILKSAGVDPMTLPTR